LKIGNTWGSIKGINCYQYKFVFAKNWCVLMNVIIVKWQSLVGLGLIWNLNVTFITSWQEKEIISLCLLFAANTYIYYLRRLSIKIKSSTNCADASLNVWSNMQLYAFVKVWMFNSYHFTFYVFPSLANYCADYKIIMSYQIIWRNLETLIVQFVISLYLICI